MSLFHDFVTFGSFGCDDFLQEGYVLSSQPIEIHRVPRMSVSEMANRVTGECCSVQSRVKLILPE